MTRFPAKPIFRCLTALILVAGTPSAAPAAPAISCHCFRERAYDPAHPAASDDYLLASTFNSLIAKAHGISKRRVVMLKMEGGVSNNDLLLALHFARGDERQLQRLLAARQAERPWVALIASLPAIPDADPLRGAISGGAADQEVGRLAADRLITGFYRVPPTQVMGLRAAGLTSAEVGLVFLLARAGNLTPQEILARRHGGKESWSQIAASLGIAPEQAGKLLAPPSDQSPPR